MEEAQAINRRQRDSKQEEMLVMQFVAPEVEVVVPSAEFQAKGSVITLECVLVIGDNGP